MKSILAALLILLAGSSITAIGQPAPFQRNPWTTNVLPQVNRGYGITIQTNAGHKLVINVDGGALTNQIYWTNIAGLLRTIGEGVYTNFVVDSSVASLKIGSIAWIDPTNENAFYGTGAGSNNVLTIVESVGIGSDALGNNSAAVSSTVAIGDFALADNVGTVEQAVFVGATAGAANAGTFQKVVGIGRGALSSGSPGTTKRLVIGIGDAALSTATSDNGTNWIVIGNIGSGGFGGGGVNLGSFGYENKFSIIGAVSNRWIFGANATNSRANSMVFGSGITNYNFRNVEYTFPASNSSSFSFLGNNGSGSLSWTSIVANLMVTNSATNITPAFIDHSGLWFGQSMTGLQVRYRGTNGAAFVRFNSGGGTPIDAINLTSLGGSTGVQIRGAIPSGGLGNLNITAGDSSQMISASPTFFHIPGLLWLGNPSFAVYNAIDGSLTNRIRLSGAGTTAGGVNPTNGVALVLNPLPFPFTNIAAGLAGLYTTNDAGVTNLYAFNSTALATKLSPSSFTNFAVASANGITTNDRVRSLLRGQIKLTLGAISDVAEIIINVTNGASVYSLTNGADTAVGAAGMRIPLVVFIGPTNTFEIKTNVSGTGTAVINNMTMEQF